MKYPYNEEKLRLDTISTGEFATFIGKHNTDYYLGYIDKLENNNRFLSWNWSCFFLGTYWLLYRKLYALASVLVVLNISFALLFHSRMPILFALIVRLILTIFINAIYLNNSERKIRNIKKTRYSLSTTQYIDRLHKKGGYNLVAPLILIIIYIIIILISFFSFFLLRANVAPPHFSSPSYHF